MGWYRLMAVLVYRETVVFVGVDATGTFSFIECIL